MAFFTFLDNTVTESKPDCIGKCPHPWHCASGEPSNRKISQFKRRQNFV